MCKYIYVIYEDSMAKGVVVVDINENKYKYDCQTGNIGHSAIIMHIYGT